MSAWEKRSTTAGFGEFTFDFLDPFAVQRDELALRARAAASA
jgi:hypothetical protein